MTDRRSFETHSLDDGDGFFIGRLPEDLCPDTAGFEALWDLHPDEYHVIHMHGRPVKTPWYDGALGHYIGPHHDSVKNMVGGAPIVTVSLGEERVFRLIHPKLKVMRDFPAEAGTIFVMPYDTNLAWKHSVPKFARYRGRRISITLRAFEL